MVQQVVLILHNARVNGLFLSSCYCLYLVLPVLPMPTYISGCWNGSHLHLSQTKPQIGDRSCSIPCLGSHCWGSASYPTANLLTRNLQNIYYIHIGLSSVVYTHEHWKVLYHLVLYIWIYILFEQLSHSKQFCSHPSGFSHNFVLILSKLITLWQLRGKKRGWGWGGGCWSKRIRFEETLKSIWFSNILCYISEYTRPTKALLWFGRLSLYLCHVPTFST